MQATQIGDLAFLAIFLGLAAFVLALARQPPRKGTAVPTKILYVVAAAIAVLSLWLTHETLLALWQKIIL